MSKRSTEMLETSLDKEVRALRLRVIALERDLKQQIGAAAFDAAIKQPDVAGPNVVRLRPRRRVRG